MNKVQTPPEPPVGSRRYGRHGFPWMRREDGWHCDIPGCLMCPCPWDLISYCYGPLTEFGACELSPPFNVKDVAS